nr:DEAD/DEAH box helicase [uncultured Desulfuromonas sp.]
MKATRRMTASDFSALGIAPPLLQALTDLGYQQPSPIQEQSIPILNEGHNLLGTAQTGTGKTAAFGLPLLGKIDPSLKHPQLLVLAPTRELAIQVSEALQSFAKYLPQIKVLAVYGGQPMYQQLKALHDGVQVVVGTPGRIMDHMERKSLRLEQISAVVLDEADEMLRMGFIDDVETILGATPPRCQCALFSATMPPAIRRVAERYLGDAREVQIASRTSTVDQIEQRYLMLRANQKFDVLTRLIEAQEIDGTIVFVRTKTATTELAERLEGRGYNAAPLNGDLSQQVRERTISRLKNGSLDIVVATDVAARGLDVERISHVFNYDIPFDTEAYIHRIGRTGRAGRTGTAILFVTPQERRLLKGIERATKREIKPIAVPTSEQIGARRIAIFKKQIHDTLDQYNLAELRELLSTMVEEEGLELLDVAAALAHRQQVQKTLFPKLSTIQLPSLDDRKSRLAGERKPRERGNVPPMDRYRISVGRRHNITPRDIVGAFSNEGRVQIGFIGRINLYNEHSTVELAQSLPAKVIEKLNKIQLRHHDIKLHKLDDNVEGSERKPSKKKSVARPERGRGVKTTPHKPKKNAKKFVPKKKR